MTIKPRIWYPIAVVLSAVNLGAVWFAARPGEPWHATAHAGLALAFGLWAYRLRQTRRGSELEAHAEPLALQVDDLRHALAETQDRLDFAERVLSQGRVPRREDHEE